LEWSALMLHEHGKDEFRVTLQGWELARVGVRVRTTLSGKAGDAGRSFQGLHVLLRLRKDVEEDGNGNG